MKPLLWPRSLVTGHITRCWRRKEPVQRWGWGGRNVTHREQEGVGVGPQLLDEALLQPRGGARGPHGREHLDLGEIEVPAEAEANHIDVFLAVAEGTRQRHIHWRETRRVRLASRSVGPAPLPGLTLPAFGSRHLTFSIPRGWDLGTSPPSWPFPPSGLR